MAELENPRVEKGWGGVVIPKNDVRLNEVIFRKFNLVQQIYPFKKKFHAIFCRNVMIYFDNHFHKELAHKFFHYFLLLKTPLTRKVALHVNTISELLSRF